MTKNPFLLSHILEYLGKLDITPTISKDGKSYHVNDKVLKQKGDGVVNFDQQDLTDLNTFIKKFHGYS